MTSQLKDVSSATQKFIERSHQILIGGEWRQPRGQSNDVIDPSTEETIGSFNGSSPEDVDDAINAARNAFDHGEWRHMAPAARAKILWRIADLIEENKQELAELEALDGGKLLGGALHGEAPAAAEAFRYHAGWCTKIEGRTFKPSIPGLDLEGQTRLEPIGVAGLITPWNGALVMGAWKLAPALASGCTLVLKPAENTTLSTLRLGELMCEAGVPDGVVNIVIGSGSTVGAILGEDARIDKVSFTGSTRTARSLIEASKGNLKKLSLELGGKSPVLIFDDANLDDAVNGAADGIFSNAGQVCVAGSRILIQKSIYDRVVKGLCDKARSIKVGRTLSSSSQMGPLISAQHRDSVERYVQQGVADGAKLLCGGERVDGPGYFFEPTVLADETTQSCVWSDEVFGPVAVVTPFEDEADALRLANDSNYGLAASVWTSNTSRAQRLTREIKAGIVWINCHGIPDMAMPIGGYKQSGWGREHGWKGLEAYLEHKSIMQRID